MTLKTSKKTYPVKYPSGYWHDIILPNRDLFQLDTEILNLGYTMELSRELCQMYICFGPTPRDSDLIDLGCSCYIGKSESSPDDSNVQAR